MRKLLFVLLALCSLSFGQTHTGGGQSGSTGGSVTTFSAGTLTPLFTTSVATPTSTPALSFSLTNAGAGTVFGNATGSAGAPAYTATPVLGVAGTPGSLGISGTTSGSCTLSVDATSVNFLHNCGLVLSGASGAPTTISTTTTNASLFLAPNGTAPVVLNAGTAANPAIAFVGGTTTGFSFSSGNGGMIVFSQAGTAKLSFGATPGSGFGMASGSSFGWSSTTDPTAALDTAISRAAAAQFQLGGANAASPVSQLIRVQGSRSGTDSNVAGGNLTIQPGIGTGTSTVSTLILSAPALGTASGTGAQTVIKRHSINSSKALTSGAATTVASIPLATLQNTGGTLSYHLEATDGTNQCSTDGSIHYSAENSAAVFVTNVSSIGEAATACTATKTLTVAWSLTSANPALLQITPTLTGITATSFNIIYEAVNFGQTDPTW